MPSSSTGDGEPDRDFPALGLEKLLSDFNLDEYCICVIEGRKRASTNLDSMLSQGATNTRAISAGGVAGGGNTAGRGTFGNMDGAQSTFGLSNFQTSGRPTISSGNTNTLVQSNSAGQLRSSMSYNNLTGMSSHSRGGRDRDDTGNTLGGRQDRTRSYSKQSYDSFQNIVSVSTLVLFVVPIWKLETMSHRQTYLLPFFAHLASFYSLIFHSAPRTGEHGAGGVPRRHAGGRSFQGGHVADPPAAQDPQAQAAQVIHE